MPVDEDIDSDDDDDDEAANDAPKKKKKDKRGIVAKIKVWFATVVCSVCSITP